MNKNATYLISSFVLWSMIATDRADAQQTVQEVLDACDQAEANDLETGMKKINCMGYLAGMFDMYRLISDTTAKGIPAEALRICPPERGVENSEIIGIAIAKMRREKDKTVAGRTIALGAWLNAYKCGKD